VCNGKLKFLKEDLKGLSPSITPFGKRKVIRIVEITIPNIVVLSIRKIGCENYLFRKFRGGLV
jgi:hypothetical protein